MWWLSRFGYHSSDEFIDFYFTDKYAARKGESRVAESVLQTLSFLGGWLGGLAAQRFLKHKRSKQTFVSRFRGIGISYIILFVSVIIVMSHRI